MAIRKEIRARLSEQHAASRDGRKAHPRSTAPYGLEEHLNEEQAKREIEKKVEQIAPEDGGV